MLTSWLNHARIRRQALLLGVCLWLVYAIDLATPGLLDRAGHLKGADFLHPYVLGSLANEHRPGALYNVAAQIEQGTRLVPPSKDIWFIPVYPPHYSLIFAPLARLPYLWAFAVWGFITFTLYTVGCYFLWKSCPNLVHRQISTEPHVRSANVENSSPRVPHFLAKRKAEVFDSTNATPVPSSTFLFLTLAFPGFATLVMFGQNSIIAFVAFTLMYFALRSRHGFLAGLALGLLAYKPPLALAAVIVFVFALEWKVILGAIAATVAQFAAAAACFGTGVLRDYAHAITHISQYASILEPKPYLMHSLRAFWSILLPWPSIALTLYAVTAIVVLIAAVMTWRRRGVTPLSFAVLLLATVLVAPHLTIYDLIITAPVFLFAGDWLLANAGHRFAPPLRLLLYLCYWIALLGPLAQFTHFQISVPVFAALLFVIHRISTETAEPLTQLQTGPLAVSE